MWMVLTFVVDTMLDRLWLDISTTPPTEYVEAANSCEATLPTKVPVSSFEMNLNAAQCCYCIAVYPDFKK